MALIFRKLALRGIVPDQALNTAFLLPNNWDDYGYKTLFSLTVFDEQGNKHEIGDVKIGFSGQNEGWTGEQIPQQFDVLPGNFFSLGQDADFYENIIGNLPGVTVSNLLNVLGDVSKDANKLALAQGEGVFHTSLMRTVNINSITNQFRRVLDGGVPLTAYDFFYEKQPNARYSGIKVKFKVYPSSKPSTNLHVLIGRNGVGKTTLINNMVNALLPNRGEVADTGYFASEGFMGPTGLTPDYFGGLVSVSFSAFDLFNPPPDQPNPDEGISYHYVGLKVQGEEGNLKTLSKLRDELVESLRVCLSLRDKKERWINAVRKLESDDNIEDMNLCSLVAVAEQDPTEDRRQFVEAAHLMFSRLSSGHAIVLLSITKLVETVDRKTLVLIDEPESHLHPPLLSAYTRALANLFINRNSIAIIATHSPVILQEIPKTCVSILTRVRLVSDVEPPEQETFGENVGSLTREVFRLEVSRSGFHNLLTESINSGMSYDEILNDYTGQLGGEAKAILKGKIYRRDNPQGENN